MRATGVLVGRGEAVARVEGLGVLGAEDCLVVGEQRLEDRDRVLSAPGGLVGGGEAVARVEGVGVLRAEDLLSVDDEWFYPGDAERLKELQRRGKLF